MNYKNIALAAFLAVAVSACASSGNQSLKTETTQTVSQKIVEGKTTKHEVENLFGAPMSTSFTSNGDLIWTYGFAKMQADAVNYIPYLGLLGSSHTGEKKELVVLFDRKDRVKRFSMTSSDVSVKSGIFQ